MNEDERLKEAFLDMLMQSCGEWTSAKWENGKMVKEAEFKGYDPMCISTYENALDLAAEFGWIRRQDIIR